MMNIGKELIRINGYTKNGFDVEKWAAPEFLDQAARELPEDTLELKTLEKIPTTKGPVG